MPSQNRAIILYVPALHLGYRRLFDKYPEAKIFILGKDLIGEFDDLRKDLRALKPEDAVAAIKGWGRDVEILDGSMTAGLVGRDLVMPNEDTSHGLADKYFSSEKITFENIFLRWDRRKMEAEKDALDPNRNISVDKLDKEFMQVAVNESRKSTNFWRRVGAAVVKDGEVILKASNRYETVPHANWTDGDPRNNANRGTSVDITTDLHGEVQVVAEAARKGISLEGTSLYVTTFPCPVCAKLVANAGFAKCYYAVGYAMLDGQEVLKANGVELIHVEGVSTDDPNSDIWVPYPEKPKASKLEASKLESAPAPVPTPVGGQRFSIKL